MMIIIFEIQFLFNEEVTKQMRLHERIAGLQCHAIDQNKKKSSLESGNWKKVDIKDSRQDLGHSSFCYGRYAEKRFAQIYRDLYGDAMLVPT